MSHATKCDRCVFWSHHPWLFFLKPCFTKKEIKKLWNVKLFSLFIIFILFLYFSDLIYVVSPSTLENGEQKRHCPCNAILQGWLWFYNGSGGCWSHDEFKWLYSNSWPRKCRNCLYQDFPARTQCAGKNLLGIFYFCFTFIWSFIFHDVVGILLTTHI